MKKKNQAWDEIYKHPQEYKFYDLSNAHEDLEKVIKWFKSKNVNSVLDLGCGIGRNLFPLIKAGFNVYGIDNSQNAISSIISTNIGKKIIDKISIGKFQKIPYEDVFFDAIISVQTLNHGYESDIKEGISEIKRVLKPNGLIFITVPGRISQGKTRYCLVKTARKVEKNTYIPTKGEEIGVPHYIFNKKLIFKLFSDFSILNISKDEKDYYCIWGQKRD